MSKYKIEPWPPQPNGGMQTGKIPAGVKVTDTETGYWHYCNIYRSQHQNKDSAIKVLQAYRRSTMTTNKQLREADKELDRYLSVGIAQVEEERDRYKAECEKLRKDAERYRWLRGNGAFAPSAWGNGWALACGSSRYSSIELDASVDAAMQERRSATSTCGACVPLSGASASTTKQRSRP